jgi:hypothetical protein
MTYTQGLALNCREPSEIYSVRMGRVHDDMMHGRQQRITWREGRTVYSSERRRAAAFVSLIPRTLQLKQSRYEHTG